MREKFLKIIQTSFPLVPKPFEELGKVLGTTEQETLDLYKDLKESKIIRQTSGILDTTALGYKSTLVAFSVKDIERAAEFINTHPGVSHNYERNHEIFNLWFTIAVPPDSLLGLEETIQIIAKKVDAKIYLILPNLKMFKIGVILDTESKEIKKEIVERKELKDFQLLDIHKKILLYIQEDIPISIEPFKEMTQKLGIDYIRFFEEVKNLLNAGYIRRFASILNHRKAGFKYNAMVVWNVPDHRVDEVGEIIASYSAVSHCYQRPRYKDWNYNIFSMIHGKTEGEVELIIDSISKEVGIKDYKKLYSTKEFKKSRIKYFSDEFYTWEKNFI
ncbi:MAG: Lrp/AsnC family transcriptional regulator [Hydrogenothermaceae bacterium]